MKKAEKTRLTDNTLAGIQHILAQKLKARKIRLSYNSLFSYPSCDMSPDDKEYLNHIKDWVKNDLCKEGVSSTAMKECLDSIQKLELIQSQLKVSTIVACKLLLYRNLFESLHVSQIQDFLVEQTVQTSLWPVEKAHRRFRKSRKKIV